MQVGGSAFQIGKELARLVEIRRQLGFQLKLDGQLLEDFVRFLQQAGSERITTELAVRWALESRHAIKWAGRREAIRRAAPKADGNRAAVGAFAQILIEALAIGTRRLP